MATATATVGGPRPVAMATRVASAEEAVQKYGQHLATPAAQGESTVPLPKEFEELRQRTLALQEEEYWVAHSLQDEALEFRLQAVAFVSHGAFLHKFRKSGREKPHRRFVKVTGGEGLCILHWEKKSAAVVRADAEVRELLPGRRPARRGHVLPGDPREADALLPGGEPRGAPALGVGRQRHRHGRGGHPRRGGARRHRPHVVAVARGAGRRDGRHVLLQRRDEGEDVDQLDAIAAHEHGARAVRRRRGLRGRAGGVDAAAARGRRLARRAGARRRAGGEHVGRLSTACGRRPPRAARSIASRRSRQRWRRCRRRCPGSRRRRAWSDAATCRRPTRRLRRCRRWRRDSTRRASSGWRQGGATRAPR